MTGMRAAWTTAVVTDPKPYPREPASTVAAHHDKLRRSSGKLILYGCEDAIDDYKGISGFGAYPK